MEQILHGCARFLIYLAIKKKPLLFYRLAHFSNILISRRYTMTHSHHIYLSLGNRKFLMFWQNHEDICFLLNSIKTWKKQINFYYGRIYDT